MSSPLFQPCGERDDKRYQVIKDGAAITFQPCGITSYHPKDVENKYCGLCHRYITHSIDESTPR